MPSSPGDFISNIIRGEDGIWRTAARTGVSYPETGHDSCHDIESDSFWFTHRNRCIEAAITRDPPNPGLPFVDVGGGNGFVAAMISGLGYRVVLIEPGISGIRNARERGLGDLVQASVVDLEVAPASVGAIGLFDVLEHIEEDGGALKSLHGMLIDGGKIYLTVPAHRWLWSSVDEESGHYRRYTTRQLESLFDRCGFDVGLCSYYFWPLPLPMFLFRSLPEWLKLRKAPKSRNLRLKTEHRHDNPLLARALGIERRALREGRKIPLGASCILVATKRATTKA